MPERALLDGTRIAQATRLVSADLAGEVVLLNLESGVYYGLDPVATRIWSLIGEPQTMDELCNALIAQYDVTREQCEEDVRKLLDEMASEGLVTLLR